MYFNNYALILNLHLKVDEEYHRGIFKYFKGNNRRGIKLFLQLLI